MQNTSKIPNQPNTLIKNFFIAGVNQKTLSSKILENKAFNIPPEVLFSMYHNKERVSQYLQFVFPQNIAVEYQSLEPRFYTFMTTDEDGFNSFIHVLTFYEEVNEAEISSNDFDIMTELLRKQHNKGKEEVRESSLKREGSGSEGATILNLEKQQRKKLKQILKKRNDQCYCMNAAELSQLLDTQKHEEVPPTTPSGNLDKLLEQNKEKKVKKNQDQKNQELQKKEIMDKLIQKINSSCPKAADSQDDYRTQSLQNDMQLRPKEDMKVIGISQANHQTAIFKSTIDKSPIEQIANRPQSNAIKLPKSKLIQTEEAEQENKEQCKLDETVNFTKASKFAAVNYFTSEIPRDDSFLLGKSNKLHFGVTPISCIAKKQDDNVIISEANEQIFDEDDIDDFEREYLRENTVFFNKETGDIQVIRTPTEARESMINLEKLYQKKRYVPVALCLETETEYHDVMRKILLSLFEEIRVPEKVVKDKIFENRRLAFAELVSHLAFLKTIPAPTFNSIYNLYLFNQVFTIKEQTLDQIPNKNSYAIKILFDVLDVKTIFYCWKALLFDKTVRYFLLILLVSTSQFLIFPPVLRCRSSKIATLPYDLAEHLHSTRQ